jgi:hypothetical protein
MCAVNKAAHFLDLGVRLHHNVIMKQQQNKQNRGWLSVRLVISSTPRGGERKQRADAISFLTKCETK